MDSEIENVMNDVFDASKSIDTQAFAVDTDQTDVPSFFNKSSENYLYVNIGEPLSYALAYVIIYRPEDPIEFLASKSNVLLNVVFFENL